MSPAWLWATKHLYFCCREEKYVEILSQLVEVSSGRGKDLLRVTQPVVGEGVVW